MDYIREVLLRQQSILRALLLGSPSQVQQEESARRAEELPETLAEQNQLPGEELEMALGQKRQVYRLLQPSAQAGHTQDFYSGEYAPEPGTPANHTEVLQRSVTEVLWPEDKGGTSDPQALSRAFERDARRYDGGFSLY